MSISINKRLSALVLSVVFAVNLAIPTFAANIDLSKKISGSQLLESNERERFQRKFQQKLLTKMKKLRLLSSLSQTL